RGLVAVKSVQADVPDRRRLEDLTGMVQKCRWVVESDLGDKSAAEGEPINSIPLRKLILPGDLVPLQKFLFARLEPGAAWFAVGNSFQVGLDADQLRPLSLAVLFQEVGIDEPRSIIVGRFQNGPQKGCVLDRSGHRKWRGFGIRLLT